MKPAGSARRVFLCLSESPLHFFRSDRLGEVGLCDETLSAPIAAPKVANLTACLQDGGFGRHREVGAYRAPRHISHPRLPSSS